MQGFTARQTHPFKENHYPDKHGKGQSKGGKKYQKMTLSKSFFHTQVEMMENSSIIPAFTN